MNDTGSHDESHLANELRLVIDTIPGLVWTTRPDGFIDFLNQRWRDYTGLTLDQAKGWGWRASIHPDDRAGLDPYWASLLASAKPGEFEARVRGFDGTYHWFLLRVVPLFDTSGQLIRWYGQSTDIDDRKRAEEQLRRSEHLARGQLEALTRTLDSIAQESNPDRLLEHVLRTIVEQSGALSVSVWLRGETDGRLDLMAVIKDGRLQKHDSGVHSADRLPSVAQDHPVWRELFRTGAHAVLEGIDRETARMRVGSDADAAWHPILDDADPDPAMRLLKEHLRSLGVRAVLFVPMVIAARVVGAVGIRFAEARVFRAEEIELNRALAHQAMLAIQLTRLARESRESAVVSERNRMARDIHDTLAQGFTGVIVQLEAAADATSQGLAKEGREHVDRASSLARESLNEARRSVRAIRPKALEEKDLAQAIQDMILNMTSGTKLRATFTLQGRPQPLPAEWDENLLRIGQEVVTNALRHANASDLRTELAFGPDGIRLELDDNGRGFDPAADGDGFGLLGIRERVEAMGGRLTIKSRKGKGTRTLIALPPPPVAQSTEFPA